MKLFTKSKNFGFWTVGLLCIPKKCEGGTKGDAKVAKGDAKEVRRGMRLRSRLGDNRPPSQPPLHPPSPLPLHPLRIFWECEESLLPKSQKFHQFGVQPARRLSGGFLPPKRNNFSHSIIMDFIEEKICKSPLLSLIIQVVH